MELSPVTASVRLKKHVAPRTSGARGRGKRCKVSRPHPGGSFISPSLATIHERGEEHEARAISLLRALCVLRGSLLFRGCGRCVLFPRRALTVVDRRLLECPICAVRPTPRWEEDLRSRQNTIHIRTYMILHSFPKPDIGPLSRDTSPAHERRRIRLSASMLDSQNRRATIVWVVDQVPMEGCIR